VRGAWPRISKQDDTSFVQRVESPLRRQQTQGCLQDLMAEGGGSSPPWCIVKTMTLKQRWRNYRACTRNAHHEALEFVPVGIAGELSGVPPVGARCHTVRRRLSLVAGHSIRGHAFGLGGELTASV